MSVCMSHAGHTKDDGTDDGTSGAVIMPPDTNPSPNDGTTGATRRDSCTLPS